MPKLSISRANMCTIAIVSDSQTEGKGSVTPKSWLSSNNRKTYHKTFAESAMLAHDQPSQETTKLCVTNQLMDNFYVLYGIHIGSVLYRYLINSVQIRRDRPSDIRSLTGRSRSNCWPTLIYAIVMLSVEWWMLKYEYNKFYHLNLTYNF